ncbi:MAG: helix-turn-helix transcriptional regulator [Agathobacter sp.]|nr:helix-turn-helix transcriptional regulator [Agathobacter sp.]
MLEFISKSIVSNRKKKGLTQEELAEKLDVSSAAISKWERGISTPELSMLLEEHREWYANDLWVIYQVGWFLF